MEYEKIKQLMDDMGNSKLTSIDIDFPDGTKISMKKENGAVARISTCSQTSNLQANSEEYIDVPANDKDEAEKKDKIVKSPMVGTFYIKPSPDSEPYVEIGTEVKKGDTLCIIEAMKLMNEIESEFTGKISKILVKDGEAVEYGTELFIIE